MLTLVQLTGTITKKDKGLNQQVLDKLKVERERGITGKPTCCLRTTSPDDELPFPKSKRRLRGSSPILSSPLGYSLSFSMFHEKDRTNYLLNLIDTPVRPYPFHVHVIYLTDKNRATSTSRGRSLGRSRRAKARCSSSTRHRAFRRSPSPSSTLRARRV